MSAIAQAPYTQVVEGAKITVDYDKKNRRTIVSAPECETIFAAGILYPQDAAEAYFHGTL